MTSIQSCVIVHNFYKHRILNSIYYTKGGGIRIILFDNANRSITLENNTLKGNSAVFGGGAFISMSGNVSNSKIQILNNSFIGNNAIAGGGGLDVGYNTYRKFSYHPTNNTVLVLNSSFIRNIASYGGGLSTYATSVRHVEHYNHFNCKNCHFERNSAQCGAAVSASRGILTRDGSKYISQVRFTNCTFNNNVVTFAFKIRALSRSH